MVAFVVFAAVYVFGVAVAAVRVVRFELRQRRAAAALRRGIIQRARPVTISGSTSEVVLGNGVLVDGVIEAVANTFILRTEDGSSITVADGTIVQMIGAGSVRDGIVTVPANTPLLFSPPDEPAVPGPYRAGATAFVPGDALFLFDPEGLAMFRRARISWWRFAIVFGVLGAALLLAIREAPDSAWNTGLFLLAMLLGIDQLTAKGTITRGLCTMADSVGRGGRRAP